MLLVCWNTRESFITRGKKFTMFRLMILVNQTCISCWEWARWLDKLINNVYIWSMLGFMAVILSQGATEKADLVIFLGGGEKPNGFWSQDTSLNHLQASFEICLAQCWDLRCSPFKKINIFLLFPRKTRFFLHAELGHFWRWCTTGKLFCSW